MKKLIALILCVILLFSTLTTAVMASDLQSLAKDFNSSVKAIGDALGLSNKQEAIDIADFKLNAYLSAGGATGDAAINTAYNEFISTKESVEGTVLACDSFMSVVDDAVYYHKLEDYPQTRAALDAAAEFLNAIPKSDSYVSAAYSEYMSIVSDLLKPEQLCKNFIAAVEKALSATTYAAAKEALEDARFKEKQITIKGYPGVEEASESLSAVEALMSKKMRDALPFILAVKKITADDTDAFTAAYALLDGVDETSEGVDIAINSLEELVEDYNAKVRAANALAKSAEELAFRAG